MTHTSEQMRKKLHLYDRLKLKSLTELQKILDFLDTKDNKTFLLSFDIQYVYNETSFLIEDKTVLNK